VAVDFFRECGLKPEHAVIKINSRMLMADVLRHAGFAAEQFDALYAALDRRARVPPEVFDQSLSELGAIAPQKEILLSLGTHSGPAGLEHVGRILANDAEGQAHVQQVRACFELLEKLGVGAYCRFDTGVVRGLAYYTGLVFEGYGLGGLQRAICGGGRYDQLVATVGGPPLPAVGFATSDVVVQDLLVEFRLLPELREAIDLFVIDASEAEFERVLALVNRLRQAGHGAVFSYRRQPLGKQLKAAAARGARRVVIVDRLTAPGEQVILKDMESGRQALVTLEALLGDPMIPL
jgi:histidyl-tRNA synthetase